MAKHSNPQPEQLSIMSFISPANPRHRADDSFVPVIDVWTTPDDIRMQRREFEFAQQQATR